MACGNNRILALMAVGEYAGELPQDYEDTIYEVVARLPELRAYGESITVMDNRPATPGSCASRVLPHTIAACEGF